MLAKLASGGTANIFIARQRTARPRLVVLKTLLPQRTADRDFVAMFLDEARIAAQLRHPNCVEVLGYGRERDTFYLVLEHILGETLWSIVDTVVTMKKLLPPPAVAAIMAAVADGLHHAHELVGPNGAPFDVVHRDVSPQNIMVSYEGQTKLLDFGVVKANTDRTPTKTGLIKGKFSYMSPEQVRGGTLDRTSDIFALGIVLFECLTARPLFAGDAPHEIAAQIVSGDVPRLRDKRADAPAELENICAKALKRTPGERFGTARAMADALRDYLSAHGHATGPEATADLLKRRFAAKIDRSRRACKAATDGEFDEAELCGALGARRAMELDLFGGMATDSASYAVVDDIPGLSRDGSGWWVDVARARSIAPGVDSPYARAFSTMSEEETSLDKRRHATGRGRDRLETDEDLVTIEASESAAAAMRLEFLDMETAEPGVVATSPPPERRASSVRLQAIGRDTKPPPAPAGRPASVALILGVFTAGILVGVALGLGIAWLVWQSIVGAA